MSDVGSTIYEHNGGTSMNQAARKTVYS